MTLPAICCVTEGVCSARHDTQHSNAGNVPLDELKKTFQGQGRFGRRITRELVVCCRVKEINEKPSIGGDFLCLGAGRAGIKQLVWKYI